MLTCVSSLWVMFLISFWIHLEVYGYMNIWYRPSVIAFHELKNTLAADIYLFLSYRNKSYTTWSQVPWYIVQGNASIWMQESSFERWHFIASELIVISLFIELKNVLWVSLLGFLSSSLKMPLMIHEYVFCTFLIWFHILICFPIFVSMKVFPLSLSLLLLSNLFMYFPLFLLFFV